jgi:hypothetical protein
MGNWGGWVVGESFATPTSDGESVYVATAQGGFFCFALNGQLKWMKHHPGIAGEYCRNGRSPLIYKDLLLSDITAMIRGIDRRTGELKWSAPVHSEAVLTPTVIRCGQTDIVLAGRGEAFRLPDGKPLKVAGYQEFGMTALTKYDEPDVVFFTGGGEHGNWTGARHGPSAVHRQRPRVGCALRNAEGQTGRNPLCGFDPRRQTRGRLHTARPQLLRRLYLGRRPRLHPHQLAPVVRQVMPRPRAYA